MEVLGIDIGGSGIKGALVNTETGAMLTDRFRIPTPSSRKPKEMAEVVAQIAKHFDYSGPIGVGFPSIVKKGICKSKGSLHKSWVGVNVIGLFERHTGAKVFVNNDADAAATAEMAFGAGKDKKGLVMMVTIGTGLGSGAFLDGKLIPNFELGQIPYKSYDKIELWASAAAKEKEMLSFKRWAKRFNTFLEYVEIICAPDLIIVGGGTSKDWERFSEHISIETPILPAEFLNQAGIIGAAMGAVQK
ncbi:MAG: ROK family protein [Bacteroidetes bacterium]|nr:ROK family protein [Bacteroidota bacterium]